MKDYVGHHTCSDNGGKDFVLENVSYCRQTPLSIFGAGYYLGLRYGSS